MKIEIPKTPLRFMWFVLRQYRVALTFIVLTVTVAQLTHTGLTLVLRELIDALTVQATPAEVLSSFRFWGALYVGMVIGEYALWRISGVVGVGTLANSKAHSYTVLFEYLTRHDFTYFSNRFAGSVANKVSHASDGADNLIEQIIWHYYPSALGLLITTVILFTTSVYIGLVFFVLGATLIGLNVYLVKRRRPLVVAYATASSVLRGVGVDTISNIMAMWQYARRDHEIERMRGYVEDRRVKDARRDYSSEFGLVINNSIVALALLLIVVFTYQGYSTGRLTIGDVVLVMSLLTGASYQLIFIGNMLNGYIRTSGEIEEGLTEVLVPHDIVDMPNAKPLQVTTGTIEFKEVDFSYSGRDVFTNLSLNLRSGEKVGLVGTSGAGKTTFVSILLRQHELNGGSIVIDGQPINTVTLDSLREAIALVPQEPILFHRSLRENIAYGNPEATDEEIESAAKLAEAHEFISTLPQKYETLVGERGVKLSGGQRQRVAIARAILKDAPILVLDEATSALDSESEVAIQKALHELMEGKTVIAIAHRLSTLREMNRIIVLEEGAIAEEGTHEELVKKGGVYARLWEHQAGGFLQEEETSEIEN